MKILGTLLILLLARFGAAQSCEGPEYNQFDFWVGNWSLSWTDTSGHKMMGTNIITHDHKNCVIHEHFQSLGDGFAGESFTVYNKQKSQWEQTWVDNSGSYILLSGGLRDNVMELRSVRSENEIFSMIWTNVTKDSMDWTWRKSIDGGKQWQTMWQIHYAKASNGFPSLSPPRTQIEEPSKTPTQSAPTMKATPAGMAPINNPAPPPSHPGK